MDRPISEQAVLDALKGLTNGEVIKTVFPNAEYDVGFNFAHITNINTIGALTVPLDWWNSPYSEGSERE